MDFARALRATVAGMEPLDKLRLEAARATWEYRAIEATKGNQTPLGCILVSVLGKQSGRSPAFGKTCWIDTVGNVFTTYRDRDGRVWQGHRLGPVALLRDQWNRLADGIGASELERVKMFEALRKWIERDERAIKDVRL